MITTRDVGDTMVVYMCYLPGVSLVSLVVLAFCLALFVIVTHARTRAKTHMPGPGGDSPRWVTRA